MGLCAGAAFELVSELEGILGLKPEVEAAGIEPA